MESVDNYSAWRADLARERDWREALYRAPDSPFAPAARAAFRGLRWFDPDSRFRLPGVKLARHASPRPGGLPASGPDALSLLEVGAFSFSVAASPCELLVFAPAPGEADEDYLLIPFRDATSGRATYGGGRYVDLEPNDADVYELDFNRAYHPYCAFDEAWACVLPPPQNKLALAVEAGERLVA